MPRNRTPVVTGTSSPLGPIQVAFATVNGCHAFWIGTLIPAGLKTVPSGCLNGSGVNGTAARDTSKNERATLKSENTVRYLSHISRVNEPNPPADLPAE